MKRTPLTTLLLCLSLAAACDPGPENATTHRQLGMPLKGGISCDCPDCSFWAQAGSAILVTLDADLMDPLIEATDQGWLVLPLDDGRTVRLRVPFKELVYVPPGPPGDDAEYVFHTVLHQAIVESAAEGPQADAASPVDAASLSEDDYTLLVEALAGTDDGIFRAQFGNGTVSFTVSRCD